MKQRNVLFFLLILVFIPQTGCKRNPTDRLVNAIDSGAVPQTSGVFTVYEDELKTGGGLGLVPAGENQSINLVDQSDPRGSLAQIRYDWNGLPVSSQQLFAGFSLLITPDFTSLDAEPARDLSSAGYTKMKFIVRGSLATGVTLRIEGPSDNTDSATPERLELNSSQVDSTYTEFTMAIPSADFAAVKSFATFTCQFDQPPRTTNPGKGCVIFLDDIRYEQ